MLFHCDESKAYFIITKLYQWLNIPKLYKNNLKELNEKINELWLFLRHFIPDVIDNLQEK